MREIKFRAWEADGKDMIHPAEVGDHTLNDFEELPFVFMQYTGLKDKNGVEIYEGDIVKIDEGEIQEIVWHEAKRFGNPDEEIYGFVLPRVYCKVIGNIYENPELLT